MAQKTVAYLDLLAFSNHVRENTKDALLAFTTYRTILETKIRDGLMSPVSSYPDPLLQKIAATKLIDSFNYFLPFSDSIFILSDNPNLFIKQLGSFILQCFTFTSHQYENPEDITNPTKVVHKFSDGSIIEENWYPALFRGGVAFGEAIPIELMGLVSNTPQKIANIAGKAVVEAVGLESKIKGPRIVFSNELYDMLDTSTKSHVIEVENSQGLYELLWPSFLYILENGKNEINNCHKLFFPAVNLWKAYRDTKYAEHYFKFIELVTTSTIKIFESIGYKDEAIKKVRELIKIKGIEKEEARLLKFN